VWHLSITLIGFGTLENIYNKHERLGLKVEEGKQQTTNKQ
jgi:hypothetical protein